MPETDDELVGLGLECSYLRHESCGALYPYMHGVMHGSRGIDDLRKAGRSVPRVTAGEGVAGMPRERHFTAALKLTGTLLYHAGERHRVQVTGVVQFDTSYIKTDEVRPLTGEVMYAGTGVCIGTIR